MIGETISHYKILEKLGEARLLKTWLIKDMVIKND
jgi:hypothetical protein